MNCIRGVHIALFFCIVYIYHVSNRLSFLVPFYVYSHHNKLRY